MKNSSRDVVVIAVLVGWIACWIAYMIAYPSPNAVRWGEPRTEHNLQLKLEAERQLKVMREADSR